MEAQFGGKSQYFYSGGGGKKSVDWDLNDWGWDGDMFRATHLKSASELSVGTDGFVLGNDRGKRELEKRRRVVVVEEEEMNEAVGSLSLKLGGQVYPITEGEMEQLEGKSGKKSKVVVDAPNRAVCQVDDCRADLSNAKDYHRRHKVCDVHSKANRSLVKNAVQRFCQQCSRFHLLQEFDEGKRSCRKRLAGHNKRRRKKDPENVVNGVSANDEHSSSYLLISLLKILSNIHTSTADQTEDQMLLSHLLKNLASLTGTNNERNLNLTGSQDLHDAGTSAGTQEKDSLRPIGRVSTPSEMAQKRIFTDGVQGNGVESIGMCKKLNNIDLNNVYDDSQDCAENMESPDVHVNVGSGPIGFHLWAREDSNKLSPPQTSGNSGYESTQSPSSSSGEDQSRTDRIVFKLFGKDPSEFPVGLREQILDWLSHSPTEIESYIRPGCIILTLYLRMEKSKWEELYCDLGCGMRKLLDASSDPFWRTGWVYTRVQHCVAFVYNGQVVLDAPLKNHKTCRILSIKPVAVSVSEKAQFLVKGLNISQSTRLLCALEGKYLAQESCSDMMDGVLSSTEHEEVQSLSFPCSIPNVSGRGFIEVEDHSLSSSCFPFIVAEPDVCYEICTLESVIEESETSDYCILGERGSDKIEARDQALNFIHEMGWLLHKSHLQSRLGCIDNNVNLFSFNRFRWLIEFSVDHDWCAVVKKLLGLAFTSSIDTRDHSSVELALLEIGLLHRSVRRNSRPMVEFLLSYYPEKVSNKAGSEKENSGRGCMLFRPDAHGPGGLTPLHIAAGRDDSENVLDALTDDPLMVGIKAWRSARDSAGLTPNDYACMRGHFSYIHLIQKKINRISRSGHVVLDIPSSTKQKVGDGHKSAKVGSFQTEKIIAKPARTQCRRCEQKLAYGGSRSSLAFYRPAMLSMVAIAAVCVCVALLFKSSPEVIYSFHPFRWEHLKYGSI